jgi:hypothetical protein
MALSSGNVICHAGLRPLLLARSRPLVTTDFRTLVHMEGMQFLRRRLGHDQ